MYVLFNSCSALPHFPRWEKRLRAGSKSRLYFFLLLFSFELVFSSPLDDEFKTTPKLARRYVWYFFCISVFYCKHFVPLT